MLYFLLFVFELTVLFFLSRRLIESLARLIFRLTNNHKLTVNILAVLFLPGTIIHELAHLLFAGVMFVPVGELNAVPEIESSGVKLGSVQIGKTDPFRRMLVGVAPVILGMILIFSVFLFVQFGISPWWQVVLAVCLIFQIGNTMFSSKKDVEGSILFIILVLVLALTATAALHFLNPALLQSIWISVKEFKWDFMMGFSRQAVGYLIIPTALDLLIILLASFFTKQ